MNGLLSYSGLTTKIRAMESHFLNDADFRNITELESVPEAVNYLKKFHSYEPVFDSVDENKLHRASIERMLRQSIYRDFTKIYQFSNISQRKFLDLYFKRYEVIIIKRCLNSLFDQRDLLIDLSAFENFFRKHSSLDITAMAAASTLPEFVDAMKGTDYYGTFSKLLEMEHPTLFDYEMALDLYYFRDIWRMKDKLYKGQDLKELTKAYGSKFEMLNLQWIYRSKKYYHMSSADIYALLIPVKYRITNQQITAMVEAESISALESLIDQCYYARQYKEFSPGNLESVYADIMRHILSTASRNNPYSVITLYSYLHHKEHEVDRLIIALECVRYRIAPDKAMNYIRKT